MDNQTSEIKVSIALDDGTIVEITPETNVLEKYAIKPNCDADDCGISKKIYEVIFKSIYNPNDHRGETLNTYNSTFSKNDSKLERLIKKENLPGNEEKDLRERVKKFQNLYLSIGNFTISEIGRNSINVKRGSYFGKLRDSWPLTLLCIQDYLSGYTKLPENPLRYSFEKNESTRNFFRKYKDTENGFALFCKDFYFSPDLYSNDPKYSYVLKNANGDYEVPCDLFDGLSFKKPLAINKKEVEQFIEKSSKKIIARGKIMLQEYEKRTNAK